MKLRSCRTCQVEFAPAVKGTAYCDPCQVCSVAECGRPRGKKSYCAMHYDRFITTGNLGGPHSTVVATGGACAVDGCTQVATAAGKCNMHYKRVRRTGSAGDYKRLRAQVGLGLDAKGYRYVRIGGKEYKEHRLVMETKIGRPLRSFENVHHIDGDRQNNDPSNLELWVVSQPSGQRVEDRIKAAIELLKSYPKMAAEEGFRLVSLESQESTDLLSGYTVNGLADGILAVI